MREIGGYMSIEENRGQLYHREAISLSCASHAILYIIYAKYYRKIYLPYYLCNSVENTLSDKVIIEKYHIDDKLQPILPMKIQSDEVILLVNYYGQLSKKSVYFYKSKYDNIIIDNTQAFFEKNYEGVDSINSCRKFFGVPDGGYLYTDVFLNKDIPIMYSSAYLEHVFGRYEKNASIYYNKFLESEQRFTNEPLSQMSKISQNMLRGIDYFSVKNIRESNFAYLDKMLGNKNKLKLNLPIGPYMYPFCTDTADILRKHLIENKVYVPYLWKNVLDDIGASDTDKYYAKNIIPLPIDQRYSIDDMKYICKLTEDIL